MTARLSSRLRRIFQFFVLIGLLPMPVKAHGVFDHNARVWIFPDHLEVTIAMGTEAAKTFLNDGPPEVRRSGLMQIAYPYPAQNAPRLFEIKTGDTALTPTKSTVRSDGLEFDFELIYPRPDAGTLRLRATYLKELPHVAKGSLVVADEYSATLAAKLLGSADDTLEINLPGLAIASEAAVNLPETNATSPAPAAVPEKSAPPLAPTFNQFLKLGIEHILTGFDHLLFLGALLIGVRKIKSMLLVITCFTLAHSVTLGLAATDLVVISSRITEPLIALSIIVVAVENFFRPAATADRYWLAGGFGLIHGFGFASALRETGLGSRGAALLMPLFSFNLGVETGQLAVAAVVVPLLFALRRWPTFARFGTQAVSVGVMAMAGYWFLERAFLGR